MKISIYPKDLFERLWQEDKARFAPDAEIPPTCLRCGKPLDRHLAVNAMSRHADVYVCRECGTDEALRDAFGEPLPLQEWHAITSGRVGTFSVEKAVLTPVCTFERIFEGPKKLFPLSTVEHPACEVAYSRSDYDGRRWWRTWFHSGEDKLQPPLSEEIDQFSDTLLEIPEFRSLDTMRRMCRSCARPTSSTTDFYLFSETEDFYIWLQMVTREHDYNLYVHFYLKAQAD